MPFPRRGCSEEPPHTVEKNGNPNTKKPLPCLVLLNRCKAESYAREGKKRGEMRRRTLSTLLRLNPNKQTLHCTIPVKWV